MPNIFSRANTAKAVQDVIEQPDLPAEEIGIGFAASSGGDVGVAGHANKDLGKPGGWVGLAEGSWMRKAGWKVAGWLRWKGTDAT